MGGRPDPMADDEEKRAWLRRFLGINFDAPKTGSGPRTPLLPIWVAAKEEADAGISRLQDALRGREDEDLDAIAEYGLHGATTGQAVQLMVALREADAKTSPETLAKVVDAVDDFRDFLDGAPIVDLIEDNPFGIHVPLRATLGPALDELERRASA
jgi:hypothetical protein